jgi:hypothetical protein
VIILGTLIVAFLTFTARFFDNAHDSVTLEDIQSFRVSVQRLSKENVKEYIVETVSKADIGNII